MIELVNVGFICLFSRVVRWCFQNMDFSQIVFIDPMEYLTSSEQVTSAAVWFPVSLVSLTSQRYHWRHHSVRSLPCPLVSNLNADERFGLGSLRTTENIFVDQYQENKTTQQTIYSSFKMHVCNADHFALFN